MFLKWISANDVMYAINNCKNKFGLDCYNLNYFFIKKVSDCLTAPLQLLFNRCIELGQYPESLKIAKVIPFFKNGNKDVIPFIKFQAHLGATNYRERLRADYI